MASLSDPYKINRLEAPSKFYTPKTSNNPHGCKPGIDILVASGDHRSQGWVMLGFVSKQSPFGQGTFMGFSVQDLREATPDEIRMALKRTHPNGKPYRPRSQKLGAAAYKKVWWNWRRIVRQQADAVLRTLGN